MKRKSSVDKLDELKEIIINRIINKIKTSGQQIILLNNEYSFDCVMDKNEYEYVSVVGVSYKGFITEDGRAINLRHIGAENLVELDDMLNPPK